MKTESLDITKISEYSGDKSTLVLIQPYITTDLIFLTPFNVSGTSITFSIDSIQSVALYNQVTAMETTLKKMLKNLTSSQKSQLPLHCQKVLEDNPNRFDEMVHPNHFTVDGQNPVIYLKGNYNSIQILDFDNKKIKNANLGPGYYQFVIHSYMSYMGEQKNPLHIAGIQLSLSIIHYRPFQATIPALANVSKPKRKTKRSSVRRLFAI